MISSRMMSLLLGRSSNPEKEAEPDQNLAETAKSSVPLTDSSHLRLLAIMMASDMAPNQTVACEKCKLSFATARQLSEHHAETSHGQTKQVEEVPEKPVGWIIR